MELTKVDQAFFELDFCTFLNMASGMEYQDAIEQAHKDIKEANDER